MSASPRTMPQIDASLISGLPRDKARCIKLQYIEVKCIEVKYIEVKCIEVKCTEVQHTAWRA